MAKRHSTGQTPEPPKAVRRPVSATHHGITRIDDYAWLKAANWREAMLAPERLAPEIIAYLEAENAYAEAVMRDVRGLRRRLTREMEQRAGDSDDSGDDEPALHFALLREIARRNGIAGLSMGMSGDFEIAIEEGATLVRVGSALFEGIEF